MVSRSVALPLLILVLVTASAIYLGPNAIPELVDAFHKYIQGRSIAIVKFSVDVIGLPKGIERFVTYFITVHNFTDYWCKPHSEVVYMGSSTTFTLVISRIPYRYGSPASYYAALDYRPRILWRIHYYLINVLVRDLIGNAWAGARLMLIEPVKPYIEVKVKVPVTKLHTKLPPQPIYAVIKEEEKTVVRSSPAVQLHSISGTETWLRIEADNYLFFSQRERYLDPGNDPTSDWFTTGDIVTKSSWGYSTASVSNGECRWVKVYVTYRYERWFYVPAYKIEILTPMEFSGWSWSSSISCPYCGGSVCGSYGAYPRGTPMPIYCVLGPGVEEVEIWFSTGFEVSYGYITVSVALYRKISQGEGGSPPKLYVNVREWYGDALYVFDCGSKWKIVRLTWSP